MTKTLRVTIYAAFKKTYNTDQGKVFFMIINDLKRLNATDAEMTLLSLKKVALFVYRQT